MPAQPIQGKQIAALPAIYNASGLIARPKIWIGETSTSSAGAWVVDYTNAGFTTVPQIQITALSADTTLANSAQPILTARSATAASGFVNLPNTIAVGGSPAKRAAAGIVVMVKAIGV